MNPDLADCEWQLVAPDDWVFGKKVRGVVRVILATIYYNEDHVGKNGEGGWRWYLLGKASEPPALPQNQFWCRGLRAKPSGGAIEGGAAGEGDADTSAVGV